MEDLWDQMYRAAKKAQRPRVVSSYVEAGGVSAAILSDRGNIYTGVCVDTCSTLGICAERSAIFQMLTCGDDKIRKVLALMPNGKSGPPCGACRELMVQIMPESFGEIEVMLDYEKKTVVKMKDLTPLWWIPGERK